ncbi:AgmX/PglI C-terminal domain-containing protein [Lujinxingia vulgaris]|nr:AgmX/PglI C-terminal domain-containing protein [Lujinxingia vulgaris]
MAAWKKQLMGTVVWALVLGGAVGFFLARSDQRAAPDDREQGFEAFQGPDEAAPSAESAASEGGEEGARGGVAEVEGEREAAAADRVAKGPAEANAMRTGEAAREEEGEAEDGAGAGLIPALEGSAAPTREKPEPERKAGTLSREALQESIETLRPIARQCYLDALKDFPDVDGRVMLEFEVISENGEGRVSMTEIGDDSTLYESSLHTCLQHHLSEVVFDSPGEDAALKVTYPFNFAQGEGL